MMKNNIRIILIVMVIVGIIGGFFIGKEHGRRIQRATVPLVVWDDATIWVNTNPANSEYIYEYNISDKGI